MMSKTIAAKTKPVAALFSAGVACLFSGAAAAGVFNWTGDGGDESWENPLNWDADDIPTNAVDIANFNTKSEGWHRVALGGDYTIASLGVGNDYVLLDLSGKTLELESVLNVCNVVEGAGCLQITNGVLSKTTTDETTSYIALSADSVGTLILSGTNSEIDLRKTRLFTGNGARSEGRFLILDGATARFNMHFYVGTGYGDSVGVVVVSNATLYATSAKGTGVSNADASGTIIVTGTNGVFNTGTGNFHNGHSGEGLVVVENGALVDGTSSLIAAWSGGHGVCRVVGAGSRMLSG